MGKQPEMAVFNVGAEFVTKYSLHLAIDFLRSLVDVYFPSDATGIAASGGRALEFVVKVWFMQNLRLFL